MKYMIKSVGSMVLSPLLHCLCCEMMSVITFSALQNATIVDEAFYESTDGDAGKHNTGRKGNSTQNMCLLMSTNLWLHNGRSPV
jgi:hypothetical protein